jgi:hypothetical protein
MHIRELLTRMEPLIDPLSITIFTALADLRAAGHRVPNLA